MLYCIRHGTALHNDYYWTQLKNKAYQYYQKQVLAEQTLDDACEILLLQFELPSSLQQRVINTNSR